MEMELKYEDGSLNAYCVKCNSKLEKTTQKLKELAASGEFECVDVLCEGCSSKMSVNLQLGMKEYGKV